MTQLAAVLLFTLLKSGTVSVVEVLYLQCTCKKLKTFAEHSFGSEFLKFITAGITDESHWNAVRKRNTENLIFLWPPTADLHVHCHCQLPNIAHPMRCQEI